MQRPLPRPRRLSHFMAIFVALFMATTALSNAETITGTVLMNSPTMDSTPTSCWGRPDTTAPNATSRRSVNRTFLVRDILTTARVYLAAMADYVDHGGRSRA